MKKREGYNNNKLTDTGRSISNPACQIVAADDGQPVVFSELLQKHPTDVQKCIVPGTGFGIINDPKTCTLKQSVTLSRRKSIDHTLPPFTWTNPFNDETAQQGLKFIGRNSVLWGDECTVEFRQGLKRNELVALDQLTYNGALQPLTAVGGGDYLPDAKGIGVMYSVDGTGCAAANAKGEVDFTSCDSLDESQQFLATPLKVGGSKLESMQQHGKCVYVNDEKLVLRPCKDIVDPADEASSIVDDNFSFSSPIVPQNPIIDWDPRKHLMRTSVSNKYLAYDQAKGGIVTSKKDETTNPIAFVPLDLMPDTLVKANKSEPIVGRYVRIMASQPGCMHIAEVKVYDESGVNIAAGKTVTMSSVADGGKYPGRNLVNTNLKDYAATSCEDSGWMQIDLAGSYKISRIRVTNRLDCCMDRLIGTTVSIIDSKNKYVFTSVPLTADPVQEIDLANNVKPVTIKGRLIRLLSPRISCMNIGEIEVYDETGTNLAFRKMVTMSSTWSDGQSKDGQSKDGQSKDGQSKDGQSKDGQSKNMYPASNAVNGKRSEFASTSCSDDPWIQVDLGEMRDITRIRIVNREDCCQENMEGAIVMVMDRKSNVLFTSAPLTSEAVQDVDLSKNTPRSVTTISGRYVRLHLPRIECMNITEVDVLDKFNNNLSLRKPVKMSSTLSANGKKDSRPGANVVNGNRSGVDDYAATSCSDDPWIEIDLGSVHDIARVRVTNRISGDEVIMDRLEGTLLFILDNRRRVVFTSAPLTSEAVQDIDLANNQPSSRTIVSGRYVWLYLPRVDCMHITEVDVIDKVGNRLALNKPVKMSSYFGEEYGEDLFPGANMVNGNRTDYAATTCRGQPWMEIDLGREEDIARIRVVNRVDCCFEKLQGTLVSILDSNRKVVYTSEPLNADAVQDVDLSVNVPYTGEVFSRKDGINLNEPALTVYEHCGYGGASATKGPGRYDCGSMGLGNDSISSWKVKPGFSAIFFQHCGFGGANTGWYTTAKDGTVRTQGDGHGRASGDYGCLKGTGWNDEISSFIVRRDY